MTASAGKGTTIPTLLSITRCLVAAAIGTAVLGIGAVHDATSGAVELLIWLAGFAWLLFPGRPHLPTRFVIAAALLGCFLALQLVPLPPAVIAFISPATHELHRRTIEVVNTIQSEGASLATNDADDVAPIARAARLSAVPDSWRTTSVSPYNSRRDLLRYLAYGVILWIAATIPSPGSLLGFVLGIAVAASALGLAQISSGTGLVLWIFESFEGGLLRGDRANGTFVNPDHFAMLMAMGIPAGLGWLASLVRRRPDRRGRPAFVVATMIAGGVVILVAGLVASASRGGLVGAMLGSVALWWGVRRRLVPSRHSSPGERVEIYAKRAAPYLVGIAVVAFGLGFAGSEAQENLDARVARAAESPDFDLGRRRQMFSATLPMVADFPLVGVGTGGWRHVFPRYQWGTLLGRPHNHAHNDYVEWLAETGVVGALLTILVVAAYVNWARMNRHIPTALRWGLVGSIAAVGWHETIDFGLRVPANAFVFATLIGLVCNPYWRGRRRPESPRLVPRLAVVAVGVTAIICLALLSVHQIREALAWGSVRAGERTLPFAVSDGETWQLLGDNLAAAGLARSPAVREAYVTAVTMQPTAGSAYWGLLRFTSSLEDRLHTAGAAVYTNPGHVPWRLSYAALLEATGRPDLALREVEGVVARDPRARSHSWMSLSGGELALPLAAAMRRGLERAMAEHPDEEEIATEVALLERNLGRFEHAAEIWLRLAEETGDWSRHGHSAGLSLASAGFHERSEEILRRVIRESPGAAEPYRSLALLVLAPKGRLGAAEEVLELGLSRTRERRELYLGLIDLRRRRGDEDGALRALEAAVAWRPRDDRLQLKLGNAYLQKGDFHRAKIAYDEALEVKPDHAGLHFMSGRALEKLYDFDRARAAYARALALAPGNPQYRRALDRVRGTAQEKRRLSRPSDARKL